MNPPDRPEPVFDLVIPLYNEAGNIGALTADIARSGLLERGLSHVILVDNGSTDGTGGIVRALAAAHAWVTPVFLPTNRRYGGGVYQGLLAAQAEFVAMMPGDNQVSPSDLLAVRERLAETVDQARTRQVMVKGRRRTREDGLGMRLASRVYTCLANGVLGLRVGDVNGQPKIFHRSLLALLPPTRMQTFTFDAQLLDTARRHGWRVEEVPVHFHSRRAGVSSWSRSRVRTYCESTLQLFQIRALRPRKPRDPALEPLAPALASDTLALHSRTEPSS